MEKHLILIDLDGTLLNRKQQVSEYNKIIIKELQNHGHEIIISTGRAYYRSHMFYEDLNLRSLMVNRNASIIHSPSDQKFNHINEWIDAKTVEAFLNSEIKQYIVSMYIEHLDEVYIIKGEKGFYEEYPMCQLINYDNHQLSNCTNLISLSVENQDIEKAKEIINRYKMIKYEQYSMRDEKTLFNIYPIQSDKANAIEHLSNYYQVPHHRIMSIGDGGNDILMTKTSGIGVAMKNAIDEVKENAKLITEFTNDESGVGLFLKQYFKFIYLKVEYNLIKYTLWEV